MNSSSPQEQYGKWWLYELTYGTEKQLQLNEMEKALSSKTPGEIISHKDEYIKREDKLSVTAAQLQRLIGSEVLISPIDDQEEAGPIVGAVSKFNLAAGTITIEGEEGKRTLPYCRVEPHEAYGHIITPTVTMLADQDYKF